MLVEGAAVAGCEAICIHCGGFNERFGLESWTRHLGQGPDNWYIKPTELNCEVQKGRNAAPLAGVYKDGSVALSVVRCGQLDVLATTTPRVFFERALLHTHCQRPRTWEFPHYNRSRIISKIFIITKKKLFGRYYRSYTTE